MTLNKNKTDKIYGEFGFAFDSVEDKEFFTNEFKKLQSIREEKDKKIKEYEKERDFKFTKDEYDKYITMISDRGKIEMQIDILGGKYVRNVMFDNTLNSFYSQWDESKLDEDGKFDLNKICRFIGVSGDSQ